MDIEGDILPAAGDYTTEEEQYNWNAGWQNHRRYTGSVTAFAAFS